MKRERPTLKHYIYLALFILTIGFLFWLLDEPSSMEPLTRANIAQLKGDY